MSSTAHAEADSISNIIQQQQATIQAKWIEQLQGLSIHRNVVAHGRLRRHCEQFLSLLPAAMHAGGIDSIDTSAWDAVHTLLTEISSERAGKGSTSSETATFVFSLKQPLFSSLRTTLDSTPSILAESIWSASTLLDKLGLFTIDAFQRSRDQIILRQQQELLELSTPVVKLWHGVLAIPLIGTLDSARMQVVMENLLEKIVETGASIAIIDITGVPTVDTLVAQHLMKTIAAARLMGGDCIISGIRPQIAQTMVHLGVNLEDVVTKGNLADAFNFALSRVGASISRS